MGLIEVEIGASDPRRFQNLLDGEDWEQVAAALVDAPRILEGRAIWHVNSTAQGGGVAELLRSLLAYARGAGVDSRWVAIDGDEGFFRVTKRLHNRLHGFEGDGGPLGEGERRVYERVLAEVGPELASHVKDKDIVFLHDPQPAGLVEAMRQTGAAVIWRCHVGFDEPSDLARGAWDFLRPYVEDADVYVFSREAFIWEGIDRDRVVIIHPSIDVFSPKNQELTDAQADAILAEIGVRDDGGNTPATFRREDGSPGRIDHPAEVIQRERVPHGAPMVTQVSRWDALKDPRGLVRLFAEYVRAEAAHLVVAGPAPGTVADDPEALQVFDSAWELRDSLEPEIRERIHLVLLPMEDAEENAAMVNALQRRSAVVVQKSIAEGFGLTVAEAMWKSRPVVASAVGGIQDQITDGESGVLVDDPNDLRGFGEAISKLLAEPDRAATMGVAARERVRAQFLGTAHLLRYLTLIETLDNRS